VYKDCSRELAHLSFHTLPGTALGRTWFLCYKPREAETAAPHHTGRVEAGWEVSLTHNQPTWQGIGGWNLCELCYPKWVNGFHSG
jgi:hypothetical protein